MATNQSDQNQATPTPKKSNRGFAAMDPKAQREIASKGGKAAHLKGTAHEFTPEEAAAAGRKGGEASHRNQAKRMEAQRRLLAEQQAQQSAAANANKNPSLSENESQSADSTQGQGREQEPTGKVEPAKRNQQDDVEGNRFASSDTTEKNIRNRDQQPKSFDSNIDYDEAGEDDEDRDDDYQIRQ